MDFSDFSEFIGPLIFGIIAWLSSYFSKKKKPNQSSPDTLKNKADMKSKFEQLIQDSFNPVGVEEKPLEEVEVVENIEEKEIDNIKTNNNDLVLYAEKVGIKPFLFVGDVITTKNWVYCVG